MLQQGIHEHAHLRRQMAALRVDGVEGELPCPVLRQQTDQTAGLDILATRYEFSSMIPEPSRAARRTPSALLIARRPLICTDA